MSLDADPLYNEKNAFYKGLFQNVIDDADSKDGAESLLVRSRIELDPVAVAKSLANQQTDLDKINYALALHKSGHATESLAIAVGLVQSTDPRIQIILGTIFARNSDTYKQAIDLLGSMDDDLEAVALLIQIYLASGQLNLAQKTLQSAKAWAQDAELIQLAESWVSLKAGGIDQYQSAFYTAQEFADTAGSPSRMLLLQAVAEIHLSHYDEAMGTLQLILDKDPHMSDALANLVVLQLMAGKDASGTRSKLESAASNHPMMVETRAKIAEFKSLSANYTFVEA